MYMLYIYIYIYIYICTYIYNNHCGFLQPNQDVMCQGNYTRFATKRENLWIGETTRFHDADNHSHFR